MKKFFKDYWRLYTESGKFYKEHWLGIIILEFVCIVAIFIPAICYKIREKIFHKRYETEIEKINNEKEEES